VTVEYELTIRGSLGPVLRDALAAHCVRMEQCTVIRVVDAGGQELRDVIRLLESAALFVQEVHEVRTPSHPPGMSPMSASRE
jgi:hypothetical protein